LKKLLNSIIDVTLNGRYESAIKDPYYVILCSSLFTRPLLVLTCTLLLVLIANFLGAISIEIWCLHGTLDIKLSDDIKLNDIAMSAIYQQRYHGVPIVLKLLTYPLGKDK
jgi:hypothetical protein